MQHCQRIVVKINNILCDIQIGKDPDFESGVVYPDCWFEPNSHNKSENFSQKNLHMLKIVYTFEKEK